MNRADLQLQVANDPNDLARSVADWILNRALQTSGRFAVSLAGGGTPRGVYHLLSTSPYRDRFPWEAAHFFWGDERFVPRDHPRSNYGMAWDTLLSHVSVPEGNIHPIPTTGVTPGAAASAYERELQAFHGASMLDPTRPLFEITLLGLGEDGHMASLFPGDQALNEREHWTAAVIRPQGDPRVTLTYPPLESSRHAAFLVAGANKGGALKRLRAGDPVIPANRFQPIGGLKVFADKSAIVDGMS